MKEYTLSPIDKSIISSIIQVARNAFGVGVELFIPKKKIWGFYAHHGDEIGGAVFIKKTSINEGFVDWIFVDPSAQGHRLGARLMDISMQTLQDEGCAVQFALVNDFNTASWNMFAKRGFKELSVMKSIFGYKLGSLPTRLMYSLITGYSLWVKDDTQSNKPIHPNRLPLLKTLLYSLFVGMALSLFSLRGIEYFYVATSMVVIATFLRIIVSYPITRSYGKVRFDAAQGGTVLATLMAFLGTWWPTFGSFMPAEDLWIEKDFRKVNAWAKVASLLSLVGLYIASALLLPELFDAALQFYLGFVIAVQLLPVFPLDGMDGASIYKYNKLLYLATLTVSVLALIVFI